MILDSKKLKAILTDCRDPGTWARILNKVLPEYGVTKPEHLAEFIAHCGHESQHLNRLSENLNYSARGLTQVWPKRFPLIEIAAPFARRPEVIANYVYANRMGNGAPESGDGWKYRGRGILQITGKDNYGAIGRALGLKLIEFPQRLEDPLYAAKAAAWFWANRDLMVRSDDLVADTRRINGGLLGLDDRRVLWERAKQVLGVRDVQLAVA